VAISSNSSNLAFNKLSTKVIIDLTGPMITNEAIVAKNSKKGKINGQIQTQTLWFCAT
jgi:hypothetical protein